MPFYLWFIAAGTVVTGCGPQSLPSYHEPVTATGPGGEKKKDDERVVLTERAASVIAKFMKEEPAAKYLRVSVADGGKFKLDLDAHSDPKDDLPSTSRGISIAVDRKSAAVLPVGIVVDYIDDGEQKGFKFAAPGSADPVDTTVSLAEARRGFKTTLRPQNEKPEKSPAAEPPAELFKVVRYEAAAGKCVAYLTPDPKDGKKHPAIIWITGGDCNSIDAGCWRDGGARNDQSASAYRKAGIVMMFPGLRGGNDNPGTKEGFLGEVEDVLAAREFLWKQAWVEPDRIYLGGHSTGGTLALLTAEYSDQFRAVFSFGPVRDVMGYGLDFNPFVLTAKELQLRAPGRWLHSIKTPTLVIEGANGGNASDLSTMAKASKNAKVQFFVVKGAGHFDILAPTNRLIAERIRKDTGAACNVTLTEEELNKLFAK